MTDQPRPDSPDAVQEIGCPHGSWGMVVACPHCGTPRHVSPSEFVTNRFLAEVERGEREYPVTRPGSTEEPRTPRTRRGRLLLDDLARLIGPSQWTGFREEQVAASVAAIETEASVLTNGGGRCAECGHAIRLAHRFPGGREPVGYVSHAAIAEARAAAEPGVASSAPLDVTVYAVVYSNYSPSEVVALYANREDAEADTAGREGPYYVEEWTVRGRLAPEGPSHG